MDRLWAPWRSKYIYMRKRTGCIFCKAKKAKDQKKSGVLKRSKYSLSMLNIYPYNNGHIMVVPYRHVNSLELLSGAELLDLMALVNKTKLNLDKKMKPHGYNIGINIGKVSGAGYPGHVHIHIVPRWNGDTNFMPIIAGSKIVSESLDKLYELLKAG